MGQKIAVACIFSLLLAFSASAADLAIFPVEGTNLSPGEREAIGQLFVQSFLANSDQTVLAPKDIPQDLLGAKDKPALAAKLGVSQYVHVLALRLEQKVTLSAMLYDATGKELFKAKMVAMSLDDAEQVVERLVRSLLQRVDPDNTRDMHTVTEKEATEEKRLFAEKINGLKVGAHVLMSSDERGTNPNISAQYDMRLEADKFFLEFGAGISLPAGKGARELGGGFLEIGGSFYLTGANNAPYIGAGIIPHIVLGTPIDAAVNIAPYLQVGFMFLRDSSTRVYADLRLSHDLFSYEYEVWQEESQSMKQYDFRLTRLALMVGIGW